MTDEKKHITRMAELLKSGATMLFEHCPQCDSPLFKIKNDVWCTKCNKMVILVKRDEDIPQLSSSALFDDVEKLALSKLSDAMQQLKDETDVSRLRMLSDLVSMWLTILEKIRKLK